jgi:hypothetical protein
MLVMEREARETIRAARAVASAVASIIGRCHC